jgi:two-component system phosphate regulon sensor histidine kinase PhoR
MAAVLVAALVAAVIALYLAMVEEVGPLGILLLLAGMGAVFLIQLRTRRGPTQEPAAKDLTSCQRLAQALEAAPVPLIVLDREGRVETLNAAALALLRQELVGQPLAWALPQETVLDAIRRVRRGQGEVRAPATGPAGQPLELYAVPLDAGGALVALLDLTEAHRLDQMRRDLVANVSHQLRTPIAAIKASLETLQQAMSRPRIRASFLESALQETERLERLVEELLELSRLESGAGISPQQGVDVGQVVKVATERAQPRAQQADLRLELEVAEPLPPLWADPERLERALLELLDNAIKFTPRGGRILVSARPTEEGVLISVSDTGPGIPDEERPYIFHRFYRGSAGRRLPGAGLGLAIVKHVVEAHGGRVWVEGGEAQGATFHILLPSFPFPSPQV